MILADKIINERKKNGWSQEELAEKLSVSRQSISKWEGAQAVPDLQRILKMAEVFNVSTDYLLKDEIEEEPSSAGSVTYSEDVPPLQKVSMEEANSFLKYKSWELPRIGIGVGLCITCPAVLIFLLGQSIPEGSVISESLATGIGLLCLFIQITIGVILFVRADIKGKEFEFISKNDIDTEYGVEGLAKDLKIKYTQKHTILLIVATCLSILCCVPLILTAVAEAGDTIIMSMVSLLLILAAVSMYIFTITCGTMDSYNMLLQEKDFSHNKKLVKKKLAPFNSIYWSIVTAIFLGYSFLTRNWEYSWIIFALAGVLNPVYRLIVKSALKIQDSDD